MLKTLADRPEAEQARILSAAVDHLLPRPSPEPELAGEYSTAVDALLKEITSQRIKPTTKDPKAVVFQVLNGELRRLLLDDNQTRAAKARLGQRGDLPAPQYRIELDPNFRLGPRRRGITRTHVENALYSPDDVQHLLGDRFADSGSLSAVSLYIKRHANKMRPQDSYILLVQTRRVQDVQHVSTAWSIYPTEVELTDAKTPLDMLKAFVRKYGVDFYIGERKADFVLYEAIPLVQSGAQTRVFHVEHKGPLETTQLFRQTAGVVEVAVVYAIDMARYWSDLAQHGVKIS